MRRRDKMTQSLMHITRFALAITLILATSCSDAPSKKAEVSKEPPKPPEPISGSSAFFQMYSAARGWAPDGQGMLLRSINLPNVKKEDGKGAAWEATFVSESMRRSRTYTYSAVEAEGNLHKGVFAGLEQAWSGPRGSSKPFPIQALKKDSTDAWAVALKKGTKIQEFLKKNPDKQVFFVLEQTTRFPNLTWRSVWGDSISTSAYSVFVDASSGEYLSTVR
jgi:hypothetical protein